jgi:hypothetical protein
VLQIAVAAQLEILRLASALGIGKGRSRSNWVGVSGQTTQLTFTPKRGCDGGPPESLVLQCSASGVVMRKPKIR